MNLPNFTTSNVENYQNAPYNTRDDYYQPTSNLYNVYTVNEVEAQYYNNGSSNNLNSQGGNASSSSNNNLVNNLVPDISKSNLTPTAKEFKPNASYNNVTTNGAVKKNTFKKYDDQNDSNYKKNKKKYANNYRYNDRNGQRSNYGNYNRMFNNSKVEMAKNPPGGSNKNEEKLQNKPSNQPESFDYFKKDYRYNHYKKSFHESRNIKSEGNWRKQSQEFNNKSYNSNNKPKCMYTIFYNLLLYKHFNRCIYYFLMLNVFCSGCSVTKGTPRRNDQSQNVGMLGMLREDPPYR